MLVHPAWEHKFSGSIHDLIGLDIEIFTDGDDLFAFDIDIGPVFSAGGEDRSVFDQ